MTYKESVLISAYTGYLFCDMTDMHELIEETLCRPVQTFELADENVLKQIREKLKPEIMKMIMDVEK